LEVNHTNDSGVMIIREAIIIHQYIGLIIRSMREEIASESFNIYL